MQIHDLPTLYPRFQSSLAAFPDHTTSLCLYASPDRGSFHAYPQLGFGFPTSTLPSVLPDLNTVFAVQATGAFIRDAINLATTMMLHEIDIACGYSVRVFDDAAQLASAANYCHSSAFVRADACLVVWGDSVDAVMQTWDDITYCLQRQFEFLHPNPMSGLSGNDTSGIDQLPQSNLYDFNALQEGASTDTLSSLSELSFLETPTTPPTLDTYPYADPATWLWDQTESPGMGASQHGLQTMMNTGTSEPTSLANSGVPSAADTGIPTTVNLATISPPPVGLLDFFKEDEELTTSASSSCGLSLDFASDDGGAPSPASFSQSPGAQQDTFLLTSRSHSVDASERTLGTKTKRDINDSDPYYFPPADVLVPTTSKRRRPTPGLGESDIKATSAPARFTVPLPSTELTGTPECEERDYDDGSSSISSQSQQSQPQPQPLTRAPPAARNKGGRRRATSARRTKCVFCPKTFTRMQDAVRHAERSCPDNPDRLGVPCPECGEVLSRMDSAQRHWRGHENPQCEPPEWAQMRT